MDKIPSYAKIQSYYLIYCKVLVNIDRKRAQSNFIKVQEKSVPFIITLLRPIHTKLAYYKYDFMKWVKKTQ